MKALPLLLFLVVATTAVADTFVYNVDDRLNGSDPLLNDGWVDPVDQANWIAGTFNGERYTRNNNGGDNTVTRQNDSDFTFFIPGNATEVSLDLRIRKNGNFWQAGIVNGSGQLIFGAGGHFNASGLFFIHDGGSRFNAVGTPIGGDALANLRVDLDTVAQTASLFLDDNPILTNQAVAVPNFADGAGLLMRSNSQFVGVASYTINTTAVPEPHSLALVGAGFIGLLMLRRRR